MSERDFVRVYQIRNDETNEDKTGITGLDNVVLCNADIMVAIWEPGELRVIRDTTRESNSILRE
ncbi:hypothetical protein HQ489_03765 [Candidatus Woesearchaeota archaeon]|nr:hypothetical protein [Candidatus Woesearchaeota archaeon]